MSHGWTFRLPGGVGSAGPWNFAEAGLVSADGVPWPTTASIDGDRLVLHRHSREPVTLQLPLDVPDFGRVLVQSCSLPPGGEFGLELEIARGEVNKVLDEAAALEMRGLRPSPPLAQAVKDCCTKLTHAVFSRDRQAMLDAIRSALWSGELLIEEFGRRASVHRRGRVDKPIRLGCVFDDRFFDLPDPSALRKLFDAVTIPVDWPTLEKDSGERDLAALERRVDWCLDRGLAVTVGPIVDLHSVPRWLTELNDADAAQMLMVDLVETIVGRLQDRVTSWEVASGANSSTCFGREDRACLMLVLKSLEAVRVQDPQARLTITVDRPWGDHLSANDRMTAPFEFLDRLLRVDAPIATINLEIAVGVDERPSRRRSPLDFHRLLERYSDLGPSLSVRLLHPVDAGDDPAVIGQSPEDRQADWLESHLLAAVATSSVDRIEWGRLHDMPNQSRPGCGLFSESREPRRALRRLRAIRKACF